MAIESLLYRTITIHNEAKMIKLLVLPEVVFNQYRNDGVLLNRLTNIDYMIEHSSVMDLIEISNVMQQYPTYFIEGGLLELTDIPTTAISVKAMDNNLDNRCLKDLDQAIQERLAIQSLKTANVEEYSEYVLYPIDEYFWVVVQKSLPGVLSDPITKVINANQSYLSDCIKNLIDTGLNSFESVASTSLFKLWLQSKGE